MARENGGQFITWQKSAVVIGLLFMAAASFVIAEFRSGINDARAMVSRKADIERVDRLEIAMNQKVDSDRYCDDLRRVEGKVDKILDYLMRGKK